MNQKINTAAEYTVFEPTIVIDKPEPLYDDAICVSTGNVLEAQRTLSPAAFFLYMYLSLFNDKEVLSFAVPPFCDRFGFTRNMYLDAYNELVDEDYLTTPIQEDRILFFHDRPLVPPYVFDEYEEDEYEIPDAI